MSLSEVHRPYEAIFRRIFSTVNDAICDILIWGTQERFVPNEAQLTV